MKVYLVARGNHHIGYRGILAGPTRNHDVCHHRHPTTTEARTCAREWARRKGWLVVPPPPL